MTLMRINPNSNSNAKLTWKEIKEAGTDDVDGDVAMAGVIEFGTIAKLHYIFDFRFYFCTSRPKKLETFWDRKIFSVCLFNKLLKR